MKRAHQLLALLIVLVASPQIAISQDTAVQNRVRWLNSIAMSGALYHAQLQELGVTQKGSPSPNRPPDPLPGPFPHVSYAASDDSPSQDVEPTISNVVLGGVPHVTTAYMSYSTGAPGAVLRTSTTTTSFDSFTSGALGLPSAIEGQRDFIQQWDPFLASNTGGGVAPGRMYAVGIAASSGFLGYTAITAVCVWHSDNGGSAWSSPVIIETNVSNLSLYLDKPSITVDSNSGYVFVTYLHYDRADAGVATIHYTLSSDGASTFTTPTTPYFGNIGGPQLAVNSGNSNLYLVWADYAANRVSVSVSTNGGGSWLAPVSVAPSTGSLIGPMTTDEPHLANGVRVFTLPMARYNPAANVLGVVWHQREDSGTTDPVPTDTFYSYFNGSVWATPAAIAAIPGADEFMPALDSDADGNVSITYYSTYGSTNNAQYLEWRAYRSSTGEVLTPNKRLAGGWSDPLNYTVYPNFIGDYQDATSVRGLGYDEFIPAWIGIDGPSHGGIFLTDVSY